MDTGTEPENGLDRRERVWRFERDEMEEGIGRRKSYQRSRGATISTSALAPEIAEQPQTRQADIPLPEASKGSSQASDQGQGAKGAKDKGKEKKHPSEAISAAKAEEAVAKAKEVKAKAKWVDLKAKDVAISQASHKEDPPVPKARHRT
nr:hypothetical protein CFP56_15052 [Quercus suber]